MIESRYWKEELVRIAGVIRPVGKPKRYSERLRFIVTRDLMVGFFITRRLIELHKVSSKTKDHLMKLFSHPVQIGSDHWKSYSVHDIGETYNLDNARRESKKASYVANQFIHSATIYVSRDETRNWSDVLITSDFDKKKCLWRIPIAEIEKLFMTAALDYPQSMQQTYNFKTKEWDVTTD